eukprot:scaffold66727_cov105-Phaeocystis_antarctica.AAC.2
MTGLTYGHPPYNVLPNAIGWKNCFVWQVGAFCAAAPMKYHLPRLSKRQQLPGHDTSPLKRSRPPLSTTP